MDRAALGALGDMIASIRLPGEAMVVLAVGTHGPSVDCPNGSMSATVRVGSDEATSGAVHLHDALFLARGKCREMAERRRREAEQKKEAA